MTGVIGYTRAALDTILGQLAQDSTVVHLSGAETLTGVKHFNVSPTVPTPAVGSSGASAAVPRSYVDSLSIPTDSLLVHLAGAETITGVKTFNAPPIVPSPTAAGQAAPKSYVDAQVATVSGGGGGSPYGALGYYSVGLTASTQAGATANSNAIARANTTAMQNAVNNCPAGMTIMIPAVGVGQAYYFAGAVTITRSHLTIRGSGMVGLSDMNTGFDGGTTIRDIPSFTDPALFVIDNGFHNHFDHVVLVAATAKAAVLDNGQGTIIEVCALVGGTQAAYDSRNGNNAPYNLSLGAASSARRAQIMGSGIFGLSSSAGNYNCYLSVDTVITGCRLVTGTKCLNGSGIVMANCHLTGGSPNLDCQDTRNTVTGCQLDAASDIAMVRINGNLQITGCLFYQSAGGVNNGPIPLILNTGVTGVRLNGGVISNGAGSPAYSFLTKYTGGGGAAASSFITDLVGASSGNVTTLWDGSGPPGRYSVYDGTVWHTDNNTGTR